MWVFTKLRISLTKHIMIDQMRKLVGQLRGKCPALTLKTMLSLVVVVFFSVYLLNLLHEMTYVWQSTFLADVLFPIHRTDCSFQHFDMTSKVNVLTYSPHHQCKNFKIALVYVNGKGDPSWDHSLTNRIINNRKIYCQKFGYDCIDASRVIDSSRPSAWSKILAVISILDQYDYVYYVDMDVVFMNMHIDLCTFIENSPPNVDFIMTGDWNGPNTGVWFARGRSQWAKWFLQTAWDQKHLVEKHAPDGTPYPFEYEQRAFHYLLDTQVWRDRGLAQFHQEGQEDQDMKSHFYFLPLCAFNSYILHPFYWKGDRETYNYAKGDLLVHFAGKKGSKRVSLIKYYLDVVEREQQEQKP